METFTYEVFLFTFHEMNKEKRTQNIDQNANLDRIDLVRGFLVESSEDYTFMVRKGNLSSTTWYIYCIAHPNTEAGLLMKCEGAARLSCYFHSQDEGLTVLAKNVTLSQTRDWEESIYRYALQSNEHQQLDQASVPAFIEHCRSPSNKVTVSSSSTPLPSAKILFDALKSSSPQGPSRSQVEMFYNQDRWDLCLRSSIDDEDDPNSDSKLVRAHRAVLEKYEYFKDMFGSGMIESEALSRASPPHSDDAPHPTKRHRASRESESSDRESSSSQVFLPTIALDIDSETLRAMVKFIYTGSIDFYVSAETEKSRTECEAKAAWAAADRYDIPELKSAATRFIIMNLSVNTVLSDLVLSQVSEELKTLYKAYIKFNLVKVKQSPSVVEILKELSRNAYPTSSGELLAEVLQTMTAEE